jgi:hypothetical protein
MRDLRIAADVAELLGTELAGCSPAREPADVASLAALPHRRRWTATLTADAACGSMTTAATR